MRSLLDGMSATDFLKDEGTKRAASMTLINIGGSEYPVESYRGHARHHRA